MAAREAKSEPKVFFQLYTTKIWGIIGSLKTAYGELIDSGKDINKGFNKYFLSVFTQKNQTWIQGTNQKLTRKVT